MHFGWRRNVANCRTRNQTFILSNPDNHGIRSRQRLDPHSGAPGFFHPGLAIGARIVEASRRFDQHVQAHHQAEGIL